MYGVLSGFTTAAGLLALAMVHAIHPSRTTRYLMWVAPASLLICMAIVVYRIESKVADIQMEIRSADQLLTEQEAKMDAAEARLQAIDQSIRWHAEQAIAIEGTWPIPPGDPSTTGAPHRWPDHRALATMPAG
jgi:hypothetical protein